MSISSILVRSRLLRTVLILSILIVPAGILQVKASTQAIGPQPITRLQGTCFFGISVAVDSGLIAAGSACSDNVRVFNATSGDLLYMLSGDPSQLDSFGFSIVMGHGLLFVSAPYHNDGGFLSQTSAGLVYVFKADSGNLLGTIESPSPEFNGYFGFSMAIDDGLLVVGSPGLDQDSGHAFVYRASSQNLLANLTGPDAPVAAGFGYSVAIRSGLIAVGAPGDTGCITWAGQVYVFKASSATLLATLSSPNKQDGVSGGFGESVSMNDGLLAVGAPCESVGGHIRAGRAYIYSLPSLRPQLTLESTGAHPGGFGSTVATGQALIVVGAQYENPDLSGAAYVFDAHSGALLAKISNPDPQPFGDFGEFTTMNAGLLLISAPGNNTVYVYDVTSLSLQT